MSNIPESVFDTYMSGKISLEEVLDYYGGIEKIGKKVDLERFIKNKFMIQIQAETYGIEPEILVKQTQSLLDCYKD